jgi:hypothetical protein
MGTIEIVGQTSAIDRSAFVVVVRRRSSLASLVVARRRRRRSKTWVQVPRALLLKTQHLNQHLQNFQQCPSTVTSRPTRRRVESLAFREPSLPLSARPLPSIHDGRAVALGSTLAARVTYMAPIDRRAQSLCPLPNRGPSAPKHPKTDHSHSKPKPKPKPKIIRRLPGHVQRAGGQGGRVRGVPEPGRVRHGAERNRPRCDFWPSLQERETRKRKPSASASAASFAVASASKEKTQPRPHNTQPLPPHKPSNQ